MAHLVEAGIETLALAGPIPGLCGNLGMEQAMGKYSFCLQGPSQVDPCVLLEFMRWPLSCTQRGFFFVIIGHAMSSWPC